MTTDATWYPVECGSCRGYGIVDKGWLEVSPEECEHCAGGRYWVHRATGTMALWPGGPLCGRLTTQRSAAPDCYAEDDESERAA